jgi:two-component system, sensor histidine kinase PdtaS
MNDASHATAPRPLPGEPAAPNQLPEAQLNPRNRIASRLRSVGAPSAAIGLTAALLLAISVLSGLLMWQSYRDAMASAEMRAESAAQTVAAHIRWIGEAAFQALRRVDDILGARPDVFLTGTVGDLNEAVAALPEQVSVWVYDADGDSVLTNDARAADLNVSDRAYFQALKNGAEWQISPLLTDRTSGRKVFTIGRRIERDGQFLGAAVIIVPAFFLWEFWATLNLGRDSTVGLIRDDGWLVARHPVPEETADLSDHVLFTEQLPQGPAGSFRTQRSPADGVDRVVGYYVVPGLPLIAIAGISTDSVMDRFWAQVGSAAAVAAPITLALLAISLWVVSLLRRDERQRLELAAALEQNRLLLREVHHRVKNNLQTVASLIHMQPLPADAKQLLANRLDAMAAAHQHIYATDQFGSLAIADFIRTVVENLRRSHEDGIEVDCRLDDISLGSDRAVPLGLIVNEVVSNAFKHAFGDQRDGRIVVSLERTGPDSARLEIRDNGVGLDGEPLSPGMGARLIEGLSRQMDAQYKYRRDGGTVFTMTFPLGGEEQEAPGLKSAA